MKTKTKQKKLKYGTPVHVTWTDAMGDAGWGNVSELPKSTIVIQQVGYVLKIDKRALHLAQALPDCCDGSCGTFLGASAIPIGCIKRIKKVKLG